MRLEIYIEFRLDSVEVSHFLKRLLGLVKSLDCVQPFWTLWDKKYIAKCTYRQQYDPYKLEGKPAFIYKLIPQCDNSNNNRLGRQVKKHYDVFVAIARKLYHVGQRHERAPRAARSQNEDVNVGLIDVGGDKQAYQSDDGHHIDSNDNRSSADIPV